MEFRRFGRTNLQVSLVGLGSGGPSQLGQTSGMPEEQSVAVVRRALDLGINLIDTSAEYLESEVLIGRVIEDVPRESVVLATKFHAVDLSSGSVREQDSLQPVLERSLERLGVDHVDLFQFHGVLPQFYDEVVDRFLPVVRRLQERGMFRFLGITERYHQDSRHAMLRRALADDHFDSIMVGYNLLAPGAERWILPEARKRDVGVMGMFAVRRALSDAARLEESIGDLKERGIIAADAVADNGPLDWLVGGDVDSVTSAGYKFVAGHPDISSVLTGTGNVSHLEANVRAVLGPPLPDEHRKRLSEVFGGVEDPMGP
jgi:L-galactose dehydrogenase